MNADQMARGHSYEVFIRKSSRTYRGTYLGMALPPIDTDQLHHRFFPEDGGTSYQRVHIDPAVIDHVEEIERDERGTQIASHPAVARTATEDQTHLRPEADESGRASESADGKGGSNGGRRAGTPGEVGRGSDLGSGNGRHVETAARPDRTGSGRAEQRQSESLVKSDEAAEAPAVNLSGAAPKDGAQVPA